MYLQKLKKAFLICLLAVSTVISATHHHSDLKPHYDCPICVFHFNAISEEPDFNPIKVVKVEEHPLKPVKTYKNPYKFFRLKPSQRAPPVSV